jgi:tetratricopeptide (TPR) repeat protein
MKKEMAAILVLIASQFPSAWAVDSFWEDTAAAAAKKSDAGIERIRAGDVAGARQLFKQAVALDPEQGGLWANLGMAQVELGEEAAALKSFRRGLTVDPTNKLLRKNMQELQGSSATTIGAAGPDVGIINLSGGENVGEDLVASLTNDAIEVSHDSAHRCRSAVVFS